MLNITENSISDSVRLDQLKSMALVHRSRVKRLSIVLISSLLFILTLCLFLPWTQNINAKGYVTTRSPEARPQGIQSIIGGRIEEWYVLEGDFVNAGDTILFLSEIKSEYFDPLLVERTAEQVDAKSQSIESYDQKAQALGNQYEALAEGLKLKRQQIENKIVQAGNYIAIDSVDLIAAEANLAIAENQLERTQTLYDRGLKTLTQLQERELKVQNMGAKVSVQKNKLLNQRNELLNLNIELLSIEREYADKLAKSQSDQQAALSSKFESVAEASKLQNALSNYSTRQSLYYITAPQSGYVTKIIQKGIGEQVKEGVDIVTIMPEVYDLAIEIYLKPQDLPLLRIGDEARLRFDGWPAIVISGWPEASTGIFSGKIVAIDRFISENGFYRVMIIPDEREKAWPQELRVGTGTSAFLLLNDVPIWYEVWRQLNGFPPEFYDVKNSATNLKLKAPLKSVK